MPKSPTAKHFDDAADRPSWRSVALVGLCLLSSGCGSFAARGLNAEGVRQFDQARYQEAIGQFQQAIYNDPNSADGYYNLAAAYHRLGTLQKQQSDYDQAESYYNQCLDRNPDHAECYRGLAVLLVEQGRTAEAFRLVEGWVDRRADWAEPKVELARLLQETGKPEMAKERLIEALALDPNHSRALAALGSLRESTGEQVQALADYQRSLWYNRFQPDVAARIAALQSTVPSTLTPVGTPGGPQIATGPAGTLR